MIKYLASEGKSIPKLAEKVLDNEDENLNGNLQDDFADGSVIARFLDVDASDVFVNDAINTNTYKRTITVEFTIINTDLDLLNTDLIELGFYSSTLTIDD